MSQTNPSLLKYKKCPNLVSKFVDYNWYLDSYTLGNLGPTQGQRYMVTTEFTDVVSK